MSRRGTACDKGNQTLVLIDGGVTSSNAGQIGWHL
jgi:hypothetical protein